jgi:endo-1,4-beta-xylanase
MRACSIAVLVLLFAATSNPPPTLRQASERSQVLIGAAVRPAHLAEQDYADTLAREFNMVEAEDAMKWEALRSDPQTFDFAEADRLVDFATRHNMKVRGHTLVWHRQNPPWLANGNYSAHQLRSILERHIRTVVGHYRGKVFAWDVANEAWDEQPSPRLRDTIWYNQPGIGGAGEGSFYIAECFRWAHEADPAAFLFYNEAEAETMNAKSDAVYSMVRDFRKAGIPIDGVGLQMHISNLHPDLAGISKNIERLTRLGLQVHITELDVALPVDPRGNAQPDDLKTQAEIYRQVAEVCLSHPGCSAIQTWGFTDKYSWIGSHSKGRKGAALLFDTEYRPKPAYQGLISAFQKEQASAR